MVGLGIVKTIQWHHLRHDRFRKYMRSVELCDVREANLLLFCIRVEDCGPIRRTNIRSLPIELRRIVSD
jgi:hypothetical protein